MSSEAGGDRAGIVVGGILILVGLLFFIGQITGISLGAVGWPLFIIVPGLFFFVGMLLGGKDAAQLAIPGSIITTIGLILFYQNLTGNWESWAYAWALIPTAVGVGTFLAGAYTDQPGMRRDGRRLIYVGLVMLAIGFVFFEIVIGFGNFDNATWRAYVAPATLIIVGAAILLNRLAGSRGSRSPDVPSPAERDKPPVDSPEGGSE